MSDKKVSDLTIEELMRLAQGGNPDEVLPKTSLVPTRSENSEKLAEWEAEVNSFLYRNNISAGEKIVPREIIYMAYVKSVEKPLEPRYFFRIMNLKFKYQDWKKRMGYRTTNYFLNWPGVVVNNETFLIAQKEMRPYRKPYYGKANYKIQATKKKQGAEKIRKRLEAEVAAKEKIQKERS